MPALETDGFLRCQLICLLEVTGTDQVDMIAGLFYGKHMAQSLS